MYSKFDLRSAQQRLSLTIHETKSLPDLPTIVPDTLLKETMMLKTSPSAIEMASV